jgi:integrase
MLRFRACDEHAGTVDSCNYCATEAALTGRQTNKAMPLTAKQMTAAIKSGRDQKLPDGHGLYLVVKNGFGFWVYQYWDHGTTKSKPFEHGFTRSKGLGPASRLTPAEARRERDAFAFAQREGLEAARHAPRDAKGEPFSKTRDQYLDHHASLWSARQQQRNRFLLTTYAKPLDPTPINRITTQMVADALRPIWTGPGHNKGSRTRALIEAVINGHVTPNPARWEALQISTYGLELKRSKSNGHAAMPAAEVPAFARRLDMTDIEDRATLFVLLTGVRRQEAVGATWQEFDIGNKTWLIPATRMKNGKDHFVPLTDAALACLGEVGAPDAPVFPSKRGGFLGHDALSLKKRYGLAFDLHGFRTTLASWAEEAKYRTNVIQALLAHRKADDNGRSLGSQDIAYMRATLFEERRALHEAWVAYVTSR